ncbi:MAG: Magnesium transporter MgtE [Deltaproteobacteria bacterium ADurb.BinA179]|jgi:magnesium transporter|nr:magnesium transporter [Deltaproteobacteria bacterium]MDI9542018.1 magnesium transporter [Pseudomonadota bacterium]OPZ28268.1 MAG: Magnesium transporter MgtE [Deltaproteobacteria bacterium ADurb.BinA179]HNU73343.1 magnesium transporter [Deltaproteobacteria bacterium]HOD71149.1 magnesium transporter [Deltaproteobacteria bacterium]
MKQEIDHIHQQVMNVARKDFTQLKKDITVEEALKAIRKEELGEKIVYFYVVDKNDVLVGVLPTRRLLGAQPDQKLSDIMVSNVVALPATSTVLDACELFVIHKFLAFPVVDEKHRIVGIVDVGFFTDEVFDIAEKEHLNELFETIGFHVSQVRDATTVKAFRFRFPWLMATITGGTVAAFLAGAFEMTIAKSIILAFFLTLVLGLGESVATQSMAVTIQKLRHARPTLGWYLRMFVHEIGTALMLGAASGFLVAVVILFWKGALITAFSVGVSILLAICSACLLGLSIPTLLHKFDLDPKISSGPVTLALADIFTLLFYFGVAALIL